MYILLSRLRLREYLDRVDELMLIEEVTLDEYLDMQFTPALSARFPEQSRTEREKQRSQIEAATLPGDALWLWRVSGTEFSDGVRFERGGLAMKREGKIVRAWLGWQVY